MSSRMEDLPEVPDPNPWVFRLKNVVEPFASPQHPGWRDFFASIQRRHNALTAPWLRMEGIPEHIRAEWRREAFDQLVEQPEDELSPGAQNYLKSPLGIIELLTTGLCLADPSKDRDEIKMQVGSLPYFMTIRELYLGPPDQD